MSVNFQLRPSPTHWRVHTPAIRLRVVDPLPLDPLGFGLLESVKDASASSAQAAGFTGSAAESKGYEVPSTGSGQASGFVKGADKWHIRKRLRE